MRIRVPNERLETLLHGLMVPEEGMLNSRDASGAVELFREVRGGVSYYPAELQAALIPLLENDADRTHYSFLVDSIVEDVPDVLVSEYVTYHQHMSRSTSMSLLGALRYYQQLPVLNDYSAAPEHVQEQIHALLGVTAKLQEEAFRRQRLHHQQVKKYDRNYDDGMPVDHVSLKRIQHGLRRALIINEDTLVQLIIDHPGKASRIADIIIERDTKDVLLIESIINSDTPAVSVGIL